MTQIVPTSRFRIHSPHLISWKVFDASIRTELTSTALKTSEGWWIIDPSSLEKEEMISFESQLLGILLTNENHERSARDLASTWKCSIYAHEATRGLLTKDPNFFFCDGEILKGDLQAIHLPGASWGETCFYHQKLSVLIMGDALIHLKETGFSFLPEKYCRDSKLARESLRRLLDFNFETMTFAHGDPLFPNPKKELEKLFHV